MKVGNWKAVLKFDLLHVKAPENRPGLCFHFTREESKCSERKNSILKSIKHQAIT